MNKTEVVEALNRREKFARREDKEVISLELSALDHDRFTDVRPTSGRMRFTEFLVTY